MLASNADDPITLSTDNVKVEPDLEEILQNHNSPGNPAANSVHHLLTGAIANSAMDAQSGGPLLLSPATRTEDSLRSATPPFILNFGANTNPSNPIATALSQAQLPHHASAFSSLRSAPSVANALSTDLDDINVTSPCDLISIAPPVQAPQPQQLPQPQQSPSFQAHLPLGIAANLHQMSMAPAARAELLKSAETALSQLSSGQNSPLRSTVRTLEGEAPKRAARGTSLAAKRISVRPFSCADCGKSFQNNSALMKHRLIHSDDRQFECHICRKAFKRQDHLSGHMNVHKSVKPFQCIMKECDKSYCDARSLRRHLEHGHNLNNPQVHSQKGQMYVRYDDGKQHVQPMAMDGELSPTAMRQHGSGGPFGMMANKHLMGVLGNDTDSNHSSPGSHTEKGPIDCPQCGRSFKNTAALNGHMRLHSSVYRDRLSYCSDDQNPNSPLIDSIKSPGRVHRPTAHGNAFPFQPGSPYNRLTSGLMPSTANSLLLAQAVNHTNHQRHLQQQAAAVYGGSGYGSDGSNGGLRPRVGSYGSQQFGVHHKGMLNSPPHNPNSLLMMHHSPFGQRHQSPSTSGVRRQMHPQDLRLDLSGGDTNDAVSAPATMLADAQQTDNDFDRKISMASTIGSPINVVDGGDDLHQMLNVNGGECELENGAGTSGGHLPDISNTFHDRQIANDAWALENNQADRSTPERRRHLTEPWGRRMSTWNALYANQNGGYAPPPAFIDELDNHTETAATAYHQMESTPQQQFDEPPIHRTTSLASCALMSPPPGGGAEVSAESQGQSNQTRQGYSSGGYAVDGTSGQMHYPLQHANSMNNAMSAGSRTRPISIAGRARRCSRGKPENVMQLLKGIDLTPTRARGGKRKQSSGGAGGRRALQSKRSTSRHQSGPAQITGVLRKEREARVDYKKPSPLFLHHSQLRSPRQSTSGAHAIDMLSITAVPYTPPPMISPVRHGSGLFWRVNQAMKLRSISGDPPPKSAPIDRSGEDFWANFATNQQKFDMHSEVNRHDEEMHPKMSTISIDVYAPLHDGRQSLRSAPNSGQSNASKTSIVVYHKPSIARLMEADPTALRHKPSINYNGDGGVKEWSCGVDLPQRKCRSTVDAPKWRRLMENVEEIDEMNAVERESLANTHLNQYSMLGIDTDLDSITSTLPSGNSPLASLVPKEEPVETPTSDANPHINVGEKFQADIPDCQSEIPSVDRWDFADRDEEWRPQLLFHPNCLARVSDNEQHQYLEFSCSAVVKGAARNKEFALQLIFETGGSVTAACKALLNPVSVLSAAIARRCVFIDTDEWSAEETTRFGETMLENDKDFTAVAAMVASKTTAQCVGYFYSWKKTHLDEYRQVKLARRRRAAQLLAEQQRQEMAIGQYNLRSGAKSEAANDSQSGSPQVNGQSLNNSNGIDGPLPRKHSDRAVVQFADEVEAASPARSRDGMYQCNVCPKSFAKLKALTVHERMHNRK